MRVLKSQLRQLQKFLRRRGSSPQDAEDLVQEAVVRLFAYTRKVGEVRNTEAFLTRTAMNLAVDLHRSSHLDRFVPEPRAEMSQPTRRMPQQLVAVADGGKTFHAPGCPYMHGKYRLMTSDEAVREGYTPCSRCMSEALRAGNGDPDSEGLEVASSAAAAK